jgi:hypothetical protein
MKIYQCAIANRRYFPLASAKLHLLDKLTRKPQEK